MGKCGSTFARRGNLHGALLLKERPSDVSRAWTYFYQVFGSQKRMVSLDGRVDATILDSWTLHSLYYSGRVCTQESKKYTSLNFPWP